jgi:hypothetical protein
VVERRDDGESAWSEYLLTRAARDLRPAIEVLGVRGRRRAGGRLEPEDLNPGLLMWDIRRRIDVRAIPARRTVLHFAPADVAEPVRRWRRVVLRRRENLLRRDTAVRPGGSLLKGPKSMVQAFSSVLGLSPLRSGPSAGPDGRPGGGGRP